MPAKTKVYVKGRKEAQRKMKSLRDDVLTRKVIVNAAKKAGSPILNSMRKNLNSIQYDRAGELGRLLGKKRIPVKFGGKQSPGALIGLKSDSKFTLDASGGALNIYWIEYGTEERDQDTTGRYTGFIRPYAPLRNAIKSDATPARNAFRDEMVQAINEFITKNKI